MKFLKNQFFDSNLKKKKKGSIPRVKKSSVLGVMSNRRFNSLSQIKKCSILWKFFARKIWWDMFLRKGSILWVMLKRRVQFCESYEKRFSSVSHGLCKSSILWVIKKFSIIWLIFLSKWILRVIFFFSKKGLILWDICKIKFKSSSHSLKEDSIPWVILKKRFNTLSHTQRKVRFFESYSTKSLSHFEKRTQFFQSPSEECSILWANFWKSGSILWVTFQKMGSIFLRHEKEEGSILLSDKKGSILLCQIEKKVQSIESYSRQSSSLWVILRKRVVQFIETYSKRGFNSSSNFQKRDNSLSQTEKKFNSLSHIEKKRVQFFESYFPKNDQFNWVIHFCKIKLFLKSY